MQIKFTKMEGLGNDFVVIDMRKISYNLSADQISRIASRRTGVGCDQVLLMDKPTNREADFSYKIFNSDGTRAEHCGNGFRCLALYLNLKEEVNSRACAEVGSKLYFADILPGNEVKVNMGLPSFEPEKVGLFGVKAQDEYELQFGKETLKFGAVSMGNPHAVLKVDNLKDLDVPTLGKAIQNKAGFRNGVNVGFFQMDNDTTMDLRVWERGAGLTPACGTGACAAVAVGAKWGIVSNVVQVRQTGGNLQVEWDIEKNDDLVMIGPANCVFEGTMSI